MAGEYIIEVLDDLDGQMLEDFNSYSSELLGAWNQTRERGNNGQRAIIDDHIMPIISEHIRFAKKGWPRAANPDDYREVVMAAFYPDVMGRAFSDTIDESYANMYDYWMEAMDLQDEHDNVAATIGAAPPPHSTEASWRGNAF